MSVRHDLENGKNFVQRSLLPMWISMQVKNMSKKKRLAFGGLFFSWCMSLPFPINRSMGHILEVT